jgi:hypothetical protein
MRSPALRGGVALHRMAVAHSPDESAIKPFEKGAAFPAAVSRAARPNIGTCWTTIARPTDSPASLHGNQRAPDFLARECGADRFAGIASHCRWS